MKVPDFDVVVVGAGPAGSASALAAARRGLRTLLVEREAMPRWKVCGACLNRSTLDSLAWAGLGDLPARVGAPLLGQVEITGWTHRVSLPLDGSVALSRRVLDLELARAAEDAGAERWSAVARRTTPSAGGSRTVLVRRDGKDVTLRARVVVGATGLVPLRRDEKAPAASADSVDPGTRVGVGAVLPPGTPGFPAGTVHMVAGPRGYVGLVRQEDGSLDVAGALDPGWVRERGGPEAAVRAHLDGEGVSLAPAAPLHGWRGVPPLTRRPASVAGDRLFLVGDAAGYVEPFTGEGMAWALAGARLLAPLVEEAVRRWDPALASRWERLYARGVGRRQRICGAVAWISRRPAVARGVLALLARSPALAAPFVRRTGRSLSTPTGVSPA